MAKAKKSTSNVVDDPTATLQTFTLADLAPYTPEKAYAPDASNQFHLFFVGRDDVHDILGLHTRVHGMNYSQLADSDCWPLGTHLQRF